MADIATIECSTAAEFLQELRLSSSRWATGRSWIFRGHGDESWPLLPTAFRPESWRRFGGLPDHCDDDPEPFERSEMLIFALDLDSAGLPIPGGATRGQVEAWVHQAPDTRTWVRALIDVMALAQHHGLPTRLLDVTYQSFVAAYFAAADVAEHGRHPGGRLCVWAMDADVLGMGDQMPDEAKIANWCCVVRATRAGNARLIAQDGAFVVWRYPWLSLEQIVATVNPDPYADHLDPSQRYTGPSAVKLTLPNGEASTLLGLLAHERVTGARLFPGPEGVIRYRYERQIHGVHPPDRIYSEPAINLWRKL